MLKNLYNNFKEILTKGNIPIDDDRQQEQHASENDGVLKAPIALTSINNASWQYMTGKRRGVVEVQVRVLDIDLDKALELHDTVLNLCSPVIESNSNPSFDSQSGFWIIVINFKLTVSQ